MIGVSLGLNFLSGGGAAVTGGGITVPDTPLDPGGGDPGDGDPGSGSEPTLAVLPVAATARWHPGVSVVGLDGERVSTVTDLSGVADLSASPGAGPVAMTDGRGRAFWRFDGDAFLSASDSLALSSRDMAVYMVGRFHRVGVTCDVFSLGSNAAGSAINTNGAALRSQRTDKGMPLLQSFSRPSVNAYPEPDMMVTGSQMQVVGFVGRAGADGGSTLWINDSSINAPGPLNFVDIAGAEIGRSSHNPGAAGTWGTFDLYELVVYNTQLTDEDGDAVTAALMTAHDIVSVSNQLVLDGDSIMQGTGDVTAALSTGMILTAPGNALIGPDWRVVNLAASGSRIPDIVARRDASLSWPDNKVPGGQNVLAFEIGRNDMSPTFATSPTDLRNAVIGYLTDSFGPSNESVLDRGWSVRTLANIASSINYVPLIGPYRALLRDPSFAAAFGAQAGQVSVIETDLITVGGEPVFADAADAGDLTYYAGDSTHPNIAGAVARATGGDDPTRGIASGLM